LACARLDEAVRRQREPEAWCAAAPSSLSDVLEGDARDALEPESFAIVGDWLDAAVRTRAAWTEEARRSRFPHLAALADEVPVLDALRGSPDRDDRCPTVACVTTPRPRSRAPDAGSPTASAPCIVNSRSGPRVMARVVT
jgi:hypothetical protein